LRRKESLEDESWIQGSGGTAVAAQILKLRDRPRRLLIRLSFWESRDCSGLEAQQRELNSIQLGTRKTRGRVGGAI